MIKLPTKNEKESNKVEISHSPTPTYRTTMSIIIDENGQRFAVHRFRTVLIADDEPVAFTPGFAEPVEPVEPVALINAADDSELLPAGTPLIMGTVIVYNDRRFAVHGHRTVLIADDEPVAFTPGFSNH